MHNQDENKLTSHTLSRLTIKKVPDEGQGNSDCYDRNEGTLDRNRNLVLQQATYESLKACVAEMFLNVERARHSLSLTLHEVRDLTSPSNMTGHVCTCIAIVSLYMYEQNEFRFYLNVVLDILCY